MGFIMNGLDAEAYDRQYSDQQLIKRIVGYFRSKAGLMAFISGLLGLNALMNIVLPLLISQGIDLVSEDWNTRTIGFMVGAILLAGALSWLFNFLRQWLSAKAVGDVVLEIREDSFGAVLERDMSFYDEFASGKIVSRVTSDTQDFAQVVTLTLNLLSEALLVVFVVVVLFSINVRLAWWTMALVPGVVVVALSFRRIARSTTQKARRALATVNAHLQETISGIAVAKNFRQEAAIYREFEGVNGQSYEVNLREGFVYSSIFPTLVMLAGLATVVIVYFGGLEASEGTITAGDWFLYVQAVTIFWFPLTSIASFWSQFQLGLAASERVFALIDAVPRVVQTDSQAVVGRLPGRIEFAKVDFSYNEQEQVLRGFDLVIPAGQTIALVGHTGAGKSSLGKLVSRFYEFQAGRLLIDGQDIRSFDLASYRQQLGVVPQTPFLFSGTVRENVGYARPGVEPSEIRATAEQIGWGEWLAALPNGLDTDVGEGGRSLSMGQRQLVALARVLLQDPAIIILDEATASIDPVTEAQIQESLDVVLQDRTAIVIAHRLSTIQAADRIVVLQEGEIIEEGDHDGLMAQEGHYAELYTTYFRHQSPDYEPV